MLQANETLVLLEGENVLRVWWAVSAMLVLLMQVGFICLEMGCVREVSRPGIAVKNFVILITSSIAFTLVGIHLMHGPSVGGFFGWGAPELPLDPGSYSWLFFQVGFAGVASTILSGALAGRSSLFSNVVLGLLMGLLIYPVFGHWVWAPNGWLNTRGAHDFAGSGVVHFLGGFTALVAATVLGPRHGFLVSGRVREVCPLSPRYATIGVVFLWIGWIGFNGGSVMPEQLNHTGFAAIGHAVLATCVAASGGGIAAMLAVGIYRWRAHRGTHLSLIGAFRRKLLFDTWTTLGGTMGGMVAITANCDWLIGQYGSERFLWVAALIGVVGGLAAFGTGVFVRNVLRVDDPVEAVSVHAGGGAAGLLLASLATETQLASQLLTLGAAVTWVLLTAFPCTLLLKRMECFRVSEAEEETGLTFESHEAAVLTEAMIAEERARKPESRHWLAAE